MKDSFFMKDRSESDYGKEAMLDFQLADENSSSKRL